MIPDRRTISERLRVAVKTSSIRGYQLADQIGIHRATLSCWVNRIANPANPRAVFKLGRILGVPANECFETASPRRTTTSRTRSKSETARRPSNCQEYRRG